MGSPGKYFIGMVAGASTNAGSTENPAVKVNANATAPGTTAGANGLSVDVTANTGGEPGIGAAVTGDVGTGTGATGVSAAAATGGGVTAGSSTGRDGGISAGVETGGATVRAGDGTLSVGDVGSGGIAGLALH